MKRYKLVVFRSVYDQWEARRIDNNKRDQLPGDCVPSGASEDDIVEGPDNDGNFVLVDPDAAPEATEGPEGPADGTQDMSRKLQEAMTTSSENSIDAPTAAEDSKEPFNPAKAFKAEEPPFVVPYNFVRIPEKVQQPTPFDEAADHERFTGNCGTIKCTLTTKTPIFVPQMEDLETVDLGDTEETSDENEKKQHNIFKFFRVPNGGDGHPGIPPASLKGMVRSVFEAVTGSCMEVFDDELHGWRRTRNLPRRRPYRVLRRNGVFFLRPFPGYCRASMVAINECALSDEDDVDRVVTVELGHNRVPVAIEVHANGCTWKATRCQEPRTGTLRRTGSRHSPKWWIDMHGDDIAPSFRIPEQLASQLSPNPGKSVTITDRVILYTTGWPPYDSAPRHTTSDGRSIWEKGYALDFEGVVSPICPSEHDNTATAKITKLSARHAKGANKVNDYIVFGEPNSKQEMEVDEDAVWKSFKTVNEKTERDPQLRGRPGWTEFLNSDEDMEGPIVFAATAEHGDQEDDGKEIKSLGPVYMYLEPFEHTTHDSTPTELLPDRCSVGKDGGLCPACAVFGGLFPEAPGGEKKHGLMGKVAFNPAWLENPNDVEGKFKSEHLKILASPKTKYFPFYLEPIGRPQGEGYDYSKAAIDYNGTPWRRTRQKRRRGSDKLNRPDTDDRSVHFKGYHDNLRIRGRKFYWHHPNKWDESVDNRTHSYSIKDDRGDDADSQTAQNVTAELCPPKAQFTFTVDFENLTDQQLQVLIWSLQLDDGMCHKLGMGKPIGLGSVDIKIDRVTLRDIESAYENPFEDGEREVDVADLLDNIEDNELLFKQALEDLQTILNPKALKDEAPKYWPIVSGEIAADEGYKFYMENRDQPLCTIKEVADGCRQAHRS